ncbi:MAG: hypothetical protein ABIP54_00275 [Candidatus Andersenbacteria bacterium]
MFIHLQKRANIERQNAELRAKPQNVDLSANQIQYSDATLFPFRFEPKNFEGPLLEISQFTLKDIVIDGKYDVGCVVQRIHVGKDCALNSVNAQSFNIFSSEFEKGFSLSDSRFGECSFGAIQSKEGVFIARTNVNTLHFTDSTVWSLVLRDIVARDWISLKGLHVKRNLVLHRLKAQFIDLRDIVVDGELDLHGLKPDYDGVGYIRCSKNDADRIHHAAPTIPLVY